MTEQGVLPTWILLRGLGRESGHWLDFRDLLAGALPGRTIECIDWPGNGEFVSMPSPCSIGAGVEQVRAVCAQRGLKPPYVLVGISMGGMAALHWLTHYPDEILHAHIINTSVGGISYWYERMRVTAMLRLALVVASDHAREMMVLRLTTSLCGDGADVVQRWLTIAAQRPVSSANLARQMFSAVRFSQRKPTHIDCITLYVSADDRLVRPSCSRDIAKRWNVALREHPSAGHDLPLDDGGWLVDQMLCVSAH